MKSEIKKYEVRKKTKKGISDRLPFCFWYNGSGYVYTTLENAYKIDLMNLGGILWVKK